MGIHQDRVLTGARIMVAAAGAGIFTLVIYGLIGIGAQHQLVREQQLVNAHVPVLAMAVVAVCLFLFGLYVLVFGLPTKLGIGAGSKERQGDILTPSQREN